LCDAATPAVQCPSGSTLAGVWVNSTFGLAVCDIVIPPPVELFECVAGPTTNPDLVGANVTDERLCEAPTSPSICPRGTDLAGVFVNRTTTDCDLGRIDANITTDTEAQCLKCADFSIWFGDNANEEEQAVNGMMGPLIPNGAVRNIFDVCNDANPRTGFVTLLTNGGISAGDLADFTVPFNRCLTNAGLNPGNSTSTLSGFQMQASSLPLQENSLTTNVKPEAEIPSFDTEPQNPDLNALLEHPNVKALLQNPDLNALLQNPDLNAFLEDPNVKALLEDSEVNALLEDPEVNAQLTKPTIDLD
jgi:hypothetical protein